VRLTVRLRSVLPALVAVSLLAVAPVQGQGGSTAAGSAASQQASAEDLRAQATEKRGQADALETSAAGLEAQAAELADEAADKRVLAARRIASAEKKEAKAQKRPAQADRLLAQAASLRDRAAELTGKADSLQALADQRTAEAATLRATAATLRSEAAALNAAADALEQPPPDEDGLYTLWSTTLTVGVERYSDGRIFGLGYDAVRAVPYGSLSNRAVVHGDATYQVRTLTWYEPYDELKINGTAATYQQMKVYFSGKTLRCTLDGEVVVDGTIKLTAQGLEVAQASAPWAEGDTVTCSLLGSEPPLPTTTTTTTTTPPTTTAPPTTTVPPTTTTLPPGQPSRLWRGWMQVGAVWTDDVIGYYYNSIIGYGYLDNPWITLGNTRYQIAALEWLEATESVRLVAAYPASELLDDSWLRCRLRGNKLILDGELDDDGYGTLWVDGHSSSPWAENDVVYCEILEHEPPSS